MLTLLATLDLGELSGHVIKILICGTGRSRQPSSMETNLKIVNICCPWMSPFPLALKLLAVMTVLIKLNPTFPTKKTQTFTTYPDNQPGCSLGFMEVSMPWPRTITCLTSLNTHTSNVSHFPYWQQWHSRCLCLPRIGLHPVHSRWKQLLKIYFENKQILDKCNEIIKWLGKNQTAERKV